MKTIPAFELLLGLLLTSTAHAAPPLVVVDDVHQKRYGVETATLGTTEFRPMLQAYGEVVDPTPLLTQANDLHLAEIQEQVARDEAGRLTALYQDNQLASKREVDQAAALAETAALQTKLAQQALQLMWGNGIGTLTKEDRTALLDALLAGKNALVRLSLSVATTIPGKPGGARISPLGNGAKALASTSLWLDPKTGPTKQPGFYVLIDSIELPWPVGLAVTGAIETTSTANKGLLVPTAAVIYEQGAAWLFQQTGKEEFTQQLIPNDRPMEGGWFVAEGLLDAAQPIVIRGAQSILGQKQQEAVGGEEEE